MSLQLLPLLALLPWLGALLVAGLPAPARRGAAGLAGAVARQAGRGGQAVRA